VPPPALPPALLPPLLVPALPPLLELPALPDDPLAPPVLLEPARFDVPPVVPPDPGVIPPEPGGVPPVAAEAPPVAIAPPLAKEAPPLALGAEPLEKPRPAPGVTPGFVPPPELHATRKNSDHQTRAERDPPIIIAFPPYTRAHSCTRV